MTLTTLSQQFYKCGGLENNEEYKDAYGFKQFAEAVASDGGKDKDDGNDGGNPIFEAGLAYG